MRDTGMTDEEFTKMVNHGRNSKLLIIMVVVYEHPKDYPQSYVARVHIVGNGRHWPSPRIYIVRDSLEAVRAAIPNGLHRTDRRSNDDPCIVEVYV